MNLENYLIEEKAPIMAISSICRLIEQIIEENYGDFDKNKTYKDEILALNTAIQMITYCMRIKRSDYYKEIDANYTDDFTYESVMYGI
ncbi:hypothetical protein IJI31_05340 [bacterium]|nr:hypothetical protein [bacterium]